MKEIVMKSVLIVSYIICLILVAQNIDLTVEKTNVNVDITASYSSISFKAKSSKPEYLSYILDNDNGLVAQGKVTSNVISITNLKEDSKYNLKILNKEELLYKTEVLTKKRVVIRFGGDVMATSAFENYIKAYGVDYMWSDISPLLQTADYSIVNLETSVSNRGNDTKPEGYGFRSSPETLSGFYNAGIDLVDIANNHIFDYGKDAFLDTMTNLNNYHIKYTGGGQNINDALTPVYEEINGLKIGFLAANDITNSSFWQATDTKPGIVFLNNNREALLASIAKADKECDVLILMLHWGVQYTSVPTADQINLAHQLIDQGVDILIGSHPHFLQGIEIYKNKPIYYSTGNFIFLKKNTEAGYTALFEVTLDNQGVYSSRIYPVNIKACKANLLNKDNDLYSPIMNSLKNLSLNMGTVIDDNGYINIAKK